MKPRSPFCGAAFAAWLLALPAAAFAQFDESYQAPRTPYGKPDLQGIWSNAVITPLERPPELGDKAVLTEEEAKAYAEQRVAATNRDQRTEGTADVANAYNDFWWDSGTATVVTRRTSLIVDPPDGRVPALTEDARRRAEARQAAAKPVPEGPEDLNSGTRCIHFGSAGPPMMPSAYNNHYQLVQTEDYVLIVNEMVHETRVIPLDGRPALADGIRQWLGSSRGHWDGDALVVETTNRNDEVTFRGSSPSMRVIERFERVADDVLLYEFTIDDPATFERPWTAQIPSVRVNDLMYEYACHEGNRGMFGILAGARAESE